MRRMRSKLFVPGSRAELFAKAFAGPADAISIDLEDAVLEARKAEARATVREFLATAPDDRASPDSKRVIVRVNDPTTRHYLDDLAAVAIGRLDVVNIPKVEDPEIVRDAARRLSQLERERDITTPIGLLLNIESPIGLRRAAELACADPRVVGLQIGYGDLFEPLGIDRTDRAAVHHVLMAVRFAAAEAGVAAYDGAFVDVADLGEFRQESLRAKAAGYAGKSCIHPSQVAAANEVFGPTAAEIDFAHRVLVAWVDAERRGLGAITLDGTMIDKPFVERAREIVAAAGALT